MFENELVNFKSSEHFMEIVPVGLWESFYAARYNRNQLNQIGNALRLHIVRDSGITVKRDFDIKVTDLNNDKSNTKFKKFHNNGDGGVTAKMDIVIQPGESWGYGKQGQADFVYHGVKYPARARIMVWLNVWFTNMTPLYLVTDAIDVPNGRYIISSNPTRKQTFDTLSIWTLELSTYNPLNLYVWDESPGLNKYTGNNTAKASAVNTNLANCELKNFIYAWNGCKGKTTQATRWLQAKLYQMGFLEKFSDSGCYDNVVVEAVARFQQKYKKYFAGMKVTGEIDQITLNAICSF